ncbi:hypothetical protein [Pseudidiomarina insulisalsae]|uniref:Uncharacterized protein n=1 Tax=Pseudidiomarina insulisalsae TaxID=575789 RepID=A0A432YLS9_9GAMM|nr:hypothetical protein [Pseudidiomarina insulisalsae]RUO61795.1 hypothetical protein CWI71_05390 [Pseudidiomarina insulisalsae]
MKNNYIARHWRGELPLGTAFWVNLILVNFVTTLIGRVMLSGGAFDGTPWQTRVTLIGLMTLATLVLVIWQVVGVWRSANARRKQGKRFWPAITKLVLIVNVIALITNLAIVSQVATELYHSAQTQNYTVEVSEDGTTLSIQGELGLSISDHVSALLQSHPNIDVLKLDSIGGDIDEALRIITILDTERTSTRPLTTYVSNLCASACTFVFMRGDRRIVGDNALLGFHQFQLYVQQPDDEQEIMRLQNKMAHYFLQQGADKSFTDVMYQAGADDM